MISELILSTICLVTMMGLWDNSDGEKLGTHLNWVYREIICFKTSHQTIRLFLDKQLFLTVWFDDLFAVWLFICNSRGRDEIRLWF